MPTIKKLLKPSLSTDARPRTVGVLCYMEKWKSIPKWGGVYEVSNIGRVKSLYRVVPMKNGQTRTVHEKILKQRVDTRGYLYVNLSRDSTYKTFQTHQLVAMSFLNHIPNGLKIVVDHIDNNPLNNNLTNLQVTTARHNSTKDRKGKNPYPGVYYHGQSTRHQARAYINGSQKHLGMFSTPELAYEKYLEVINKNPIKVIIAGCRDFFDYETVKKQCDIKLRDLSKQGQIEIVYGGATGVDTLGKRYADEHKMGTTLFPADWGTNGYAAGPIRNREMAEYADYLIAFWDGKSKGTKSMIHEAKQADLRVQVFNIV